MDSSSIALLSQQNFFNFYGLFQELDTSFSNDVSDTKRRRIDSGWEPSNDDGPFKEVLDPFVSFDGGIGKSDETNPEFEFQRPPVPNLGLNFNIDLGQESIVALNETDQGRVRKIRRQPEDVAVGDSGIVSCGGTQQRRLWMKSRSKDWWEYHNSDDCSDEEFRKAFRMSKKTFNMICHELDSAVTKKDTMLRLAIPVRQRVAVCIYRLATGDPLRLVSKLFGLGISTCHKLVLEGCAAIKTVLLPKFLHWPDEINSSEINDEFESISGIPNVIGSIYTTHIPIIAPKVSAPSYFNQKHTERNQKPSYSTTIQAVVNSRGVFTDVSIGWPGSMSDDKILEKSALLQRANRGLISGWVVGNSGFPLTDWLLAPYSHQNLSWSQYSFNEKIRGIQKVAMDSFSRLKGRWGCLQKRTEVKLQELPVVLGACCVLHNICELMNEEMDPSLIFDPADDVVAAENAVRSVSSMRNRDRIAHNLLHYSHGGSGFRLGEEKDRSREFMLGYSSRNVQSHVI